MTAPLDNALASVDVDRGSERVTAALRGEIDLSTIGAVGSVLTAALTEAGDTTFVVDLRQLAFIDSSGLHGLWMLREQAVRQNSRLILVRGPRQIQQLFELTATDELFEFVDDPASIAQPTPAPTPPAA